MKLSWLLFRLNGQIHILTSNTESDIKEHVTSASFGPHLLTYPFDTNQNSRCKRYLRLKFGPTKKGFLGPGRSRFVSGAKTQTVRPITGS